MADRYWVGGSGTWDASTTTNWSATSGGAGGASAPTSADNVFFNSASSAGNYTVSTSGSPVCADISVAKAAAGTLNVTGSVGISVYGSWTSVATGVSWGMPVSFLGSAASTITTNGLTLAGGMTLNRVGGSLQLQDNISTLSAGTLALTAGTLDLNGFNITCNFVATSSNAVRVLAFGTGGTITCPNTTGGFVWSAGDATNFSWTGTGSVNFTYSGSVGSRTIAHGTTGGGATTKAPPFNISAGSDNITFSAGINYFSDLNFTGFNGTVANSTKYIYGNLTIGSGTTITSGTLGFAFVATSGTNILTTNGRTIDVPITVGAIGQTLQLGDNFTGGATTTSIFTISGGTVDLNGKTLTVTAMSTTGSSTRGITGNGGVINIFGNSSTVYNGAVTTSATFSNVTINLTYAGSTGTRGVALGTLTEANSISVNVTAGTDIVALAGSYRDLNFTGFSGTLSATTRTVYGNLTYSPTMTVTASSGVTTTLAATSGTKTITTNGILVVNSFTINGVGGTFQLADNFTIYSAGVGTLFTLTGGTLDLNNKTLTAGFMNSNGSGVRSIAFGTSGSINLAYFSTTMWNAATATNFTYTGSGNVTLSNAASAGNRTLVHGSTAGVFPTNLPPTFNIVAGTDNVITTATGNFNNINFTGFSGNLINAARNIYGNLIFSPTMNLAVGASTTNFIAPSNTQIFDTANLTIRNPITIGNSTSNGTVVLANALTTTNANLLTVTSGTLNANSQNISVAGFVSTGNAVRAVNISNTTIELTGTGNLWNVVNSNNLTLNSANSTIIANNSSGNPTLYLGNGLAYDNVVFSGAGLSTIYPSGNITINTLTSTKSGAQTFVFNGNVTNYTTVNNWNIVGDASNTITLTSDSSTPFNLVYGGNSNVSVDYYTISYSNASPDNKWYALYTNNNTNGGNNTGWIFTLPATSSNFFLVF